MAINVTPIPKLIDLVAPAFTLGTANAAGSAKSSIASNSTLLAFDAVAVDAITFGQSGAVGSAVVSSRRDHAHAMEAETPTVAASQAEMKAASDNTVFVTPGRTQYNPGVAKAWCQVTTGGGLGSGDWGVASVAKGATGKYVITFDTAFSSAVYAVSVTVESGAAIFGSKSTAASDTAAIDIWTAAGAAVDAAFYFTAFGDL